MIHGRKVSFLAVARVERLAEKIRAFLMRGRVGDAFDLYHFAKQGVSARDRADLPGLVATKLTEDDDVPNGVDLRDWFDERVAALSKSWSKAALRISIRARSSSGCATRRSYASTRVKSSSAAYVRDADLHWAHFDFFESSTLEYASFTASAEAGPDDDRTDARGDPGG